MLTEHLIQVASYKGRKPRVIEVLGIIADKGDGKALSFLHSLEEDQEVGSQAKRTREEIVSTRV